MIFGIDAGHEGVGGGLDCGATCYNLYEANITLAVAKALRDKLLQYQNVSVIMTREEAKKQSLKEKTDLLNKYNLDYALSIHVNAGRGTGSEIYVYKKNSKCEEISTVILTEYLKKTGLVNRGLKEGDFHMVRETKDPAGLVELFFIDREEDVKKIASNIDLMAEGLLNGYVKKFNLVKKPSSIKPEDNQGTGGTWRVIVGSFKDKINAIKQVNLLKTKGIDSFAAYYSDTKTYRVIAGSFKDKANAEKQKKDLTIKGLDCFIVYYK